MTALGLASEKLGSSLGPLESVVINRAFDSYSVHESSVFEMHVIILFSCINFSVVERWMFTEKYVDQKGASFMNSFHFKYFLKIILEQLCIEKLLFEYLLGAHSIVGQWWSPRKGDKKFETQPLV